MKIKLGFVKFIGQIVVQELDLVSHEIQQNLMDMTELSDLSLQGLIIGQPEHFQELHQLIAKEKNYYPILEAQDLKISLLDFENLNATKCRELYEKIQHRWLMAQNMSSIENLIDFFNHLHPLWMSDRMTFMEEIWYWLSRNLGSVHLSVFFNDIEQIEETDKQLKPKLTQSVLSGEKKAHFRQTTPAESEVFKQFTQNHHEPFVVVEFDSLKGRLVAFAEIKRSPLLIMAQTNSFNPLQRSVISALMKALAKT